MYDVIKNKMDNVFQKDKLEEQLAIHKISRDQVLRETLGKNIKDFNNWKVKWSRLINKKSTDPKNFGLLELSEMLAEYFNRKKYDDLPNISTTHFITKRCIINVFGVFMLNGQIRICGKKNYWKLKVNENWCHHWGILIKQGYMQGGVRFIKKLDHVRDEADYSLSVVRQRKTKIHYLGWLIPLSNGKYDIEDRSAITNERIKILASNIDIEASSKVDGMSYPQSESWVSSTRR